MAEAYYGATVDDVRALVPHRRIDESTKPSAEQVEGFLAFTAGEVAARIDLLALAGYTAERLTALDPVAKGLVAMGAASMAEDAGHPEQTGRGASAYGGVLWDRYTQRLDSLAELLDVDTGDNGDPGVDGSLDRPAYSFPEPRMRATTGF